MWLLASGAASVAGLVTVLDASIATPSGSTLLALPRSDEAVAGLIILAVSALALWPTFLGGRLMSAIALLLVLGNTALLCFGPTTLPLAVSGFGVIVAAAAYATHSRLWRGGWAAGTAAALAIGIPILALSRQQSPVDGMMPSALTAGLTRGLAATFLTLGIAFMARAWCESPRWALHAPTWLGAASTTLLAVVSIAFWHSLTVVEWETILDQARSREMAAGQVLRSDLTERVGEFERMARRIGEDRDSTDRDWTAEIEASKETLPSLQTVEIVDERMVVIDAYPRTAALTSLTALLQTDDDRLRAARSAMSMGSVETASPVDSLGGGSSMLTCIPIHCRDGDMLVLFSLDLADFVEHKIGALDHGFAIEVFNQGQLVFERSSEPGPDLTTPGTLSVAQNSRWIVKASPLPEWVDISKSLLPALVLVVSLIGSALVGSTIYFAQSSATKATASERAHGQLRHLLDAASNVAIVVTDTNGTITVFNDGAEHLTGFDASEIVGSRSPDCFVEVEQLWRADEGSPLRNHPAERFGALLSRLSEATLSDWTWVRRDGERRRVSMSATAWRSNDGTLIGHLFIAVDVTERELAMNQLAHAKRQAESANAAKSAFLANISHEIRTPMAAILGYSDLMVDAATSTEERREFAETIRRNGAHLLTILNDLLDLSKIEAGRMQVESIAVQPHEVLEEVVRLMNIRATAKRLELRYIPSNDEYAHTLVLTDPLRLRQILMNLIGNAVKFTESGWVRAAMRFQKQGDRLRIWFDIADSGVGLREEEIRRLFQAFSQGDTSTTRRHGGTGLGLAISKRLSELLGGGITVQSRLNEGSTFTLEIEAGLAPLGDGDHLDAVSGALSRTEPWTESGVVEAMGSTAVDAGTGRTAPAADASAMPQPLLGVRVLLVDDGADNRELLARIFERAGSVVTVARDGRESLDLVVRAGASGKSFDVILMDMQMPELDGYLTTKRLRSIGYRGRIVALTGHALDGDRNRCMEAGCDAYAVKPIPREELIRLCLIDREQVGPAAELLANSDKNNSGKTPSDQPRGAQI